MRSFLSILVAVLLAGCSLPIDSKDLPAVIGQLGQDQASACLWIGGRAGIAAGTLIPPIPAGGYGSGEILLGRLNSPDTRLTVDNGKCVIERGPNIKDQPADKPMDAPKVLPEVKSPPGTF